MKRIVVIFLILMVILSAAEAETDLSGYFIDGGNVSRENYILENDYVEEIGGISFSVHGICTDGIWLYTDYNCTVADAGDTEVIFWDGMTLHNIDTLHTDPSEKDAYYVCAWPVVDNYVAVDTFDYEIIGDTVHYLTKGGIAEDPDFESLVNQAKVTIRSEEYVTVHFRINVIKVTCGFTAFKEYDVFYDCPVTVPDYCRTFSGTVEIDSMPVDFSFTYIETPFEVYLISEDHDSSRDYFIFDSAGNMLSMRQTQITLETMQTIRKSNQLYIAESKSNFFSGNRARIICEDTQNRYAEFISP